MNVSRQLLKSDKNKILIHKARSSAQGDIWLLSIEDKKIIIKDISRQPFLWRKFIGKHALAHEIRILKRLQDIEGIPYFYGILDSEAYAMQFLEAKRLPHSNENKLTLDFFTLLKALVSQMHERGIAHGDLRRKNILIDEKGKPYLIDFTTAVFKKSDTKLSFSKWLFNYLVHIDSLKLLKIQNSYFKHSLTDEEVICLQKQPFLLRIGRKLRKTLYRPFKGRNLKRLFRRYL